MRFESSVVNTVGSCHIGRAGFAAAPNAMEIHMQLDPSLRELMYLALGVCPCGNTDMGLSFGISYGQGCDVWKADEWWNRRLTFPSRVGSNLVRISLSGEQDIGIPARSVVVMMSRQRGDVPYSKPLLEQS